MVKISNVIVEKISLQSQSQPKLLSGDLYFMYFNQLSYKLLQTYLYQLSIFIFAQHSIFHYYSIQLFLWTINA